LHGYGDSADTWRPALRKLDDTGRRAIAVDLPGFGHADPRQAGPLLPQFDAFADAVLEAVGPAVVMGNSLGAATAVRAATRNDAVKALVALDDPLGVHSWVSRLARRRAVSPVFWACLGRAPVPGNAVRWVSRHAMARVLYGRGAQPDPDVVAHWTRSLTSVTDVATLGRYAFQYAHETRGGHRELRVGCPTLIVHGARDRVIPVYASRILHQQIPGSELVVLPRSGHCPQLDDPAEVVGLLLRFLEKVE
jgi:pimeloyl-ACP methyl ester carboxylesterase